LSISTIFLFFKKNCIFGGSDNEIQLWKCDSCSSPSGLAKCRVCSGNQIESPDYLHQSRSGDEFFHLECIKKTRPKPEVINETYIYVRKKISSPGLGTVCVQTLILGCYLC